MQHSDAGAEKVRALVEELLADCDPATVNDTDFLGAQFDRGLAWVHFPVGRGGLGLEPNLQTLVDMPLAAAGAPAPMWMNPIGVGMGAPTLLAYATDEQLDRLLRPLFTSEERWCQLFSEPGAGSDIAGLSTRSVRDGDEWVVNGQKVWTSVGHLARWGLLLTRTDPDVPKHKGLSYFVVDMTSPGVDVRPLIQLTGDSEFNEVYLTDVRVPDANRLGEVGDGWKVALTTLMNERVAIGGMVPPRGGGAIDGALRAWAEYGDGDPALRDELVHWWVETEVLRLTNIRALQTRTAGTPGPDGSIGKMMSAELNKKVWSFTMNLMGMDAALYPEGYRMGHAPQEDLQHRGPQLQFLRVSANSIEGGTTEIMHNILGERVLGLPGDIRVDKDRPWAEVPRS
ncbi:MAG TPA: acyl-CoA dehydrogenase family protein [Jatrophihabitantaceae bacterium]|nr:acyl-CoA dehydrogenase family protein [Jatrophihabitantaceae bacterium]